MPGALLWGYDTTNKVWIPLQVDANGYVKVDLSNINLNDLANVSTGAPDDNDVLYWDAATSLWKAKAPYTSPTTTAGDIIKRGATKDVRLPIGAAGRVLTVVAGAPAWSAAPGGTKIQDADGDTSWDTEQSADEDKIHGKVKGVEAFLLSDLGILTLAKQSGLKYYLGSNQSIASGQQDPFVKVQLDTKVFDRQDEFTVGSTYGMTVKEDGMYLLIAKVRFLLMSDGDRCIVAVYVNGMDTADGVLAMTQYAPANSSHIGVLGIDIISLSANDLVCLGVYHDHGSNVNLEGVQYSTYLSIAKLF